MALFQRKEFVMHSGGTAHYKIECDELTDEDIETLAFIIQAKMSANGGTGIKSVYGVPRGGVRLAKALEQYLDPNGTIRLIVDDVLTTGRSMEEARMQGKGDYGVVIFARGQCASWVRPIFDMRWFNTTDVFPN